MFVDVILPLPFYELFTYSVPEGIQHKIGVGHRVIVPFGNKKHYTAVIRKIHNEPPLGFEVKEIHSLIDSHHVVNEQQFMLWEWVSFYYMSPLGDVYKAALPSSMKPKDLQQKPKPRTQTFIRLNPSLDDKLAYSKIGRAKKQQTLLEEIKNYFITNKVDNIAKKETIKLHKYSPAVLRGLLQKNILQLYEIEMALLENKSQATRKPFPLSVTQQKAFESIKNSLKEHQTSLLHGVTASGKTEIYIHLLQSVVDKGKQALYLLPEIALTTQLTKRLQSVFGNKIAIYHSKINEHERAEIWQKMLSDHPYEIILGVRSSLFLPFQRLDFIIVDEEHETSYKQQEPSPRYHARDTAVMLGHMTGAKTLLGSATPSIESYHNAKKGKYGFVTINERYRDIMMPKIYLENTNDLRRRKKMKSILTPFLIEQIDKALSDDEQIILFRNRRGFSSFVECEECGWIAKCKKCDVSLTYHKQSGRLICHYCNASTSLPTKCPSCEKSNLAPRGLGTEQLEEEVSKLFPDAIVGRMDTDSVRNKKSLEDIIYDFQEKRINILVGTQMLSKGLDFDNVRVVGIISADSLLNYPSFRSHERGFQLMLQASGRAGRKNKQGSVIIQSSDPNQPIYNLIKENNYEGFYLQQIEERHAFHYPPFYRLIRVTLKNKNEKTVETASSFFANQLKNSLNDRVLGPNKPVISRIQLHHIREILLKLENNLSPHQVRSQLIEAEKRLRDIQKFRYVTLYYDVDPL